MDLSDPTAASGAPGTSNSEPIRRRVREVMAGVFQLETAEVSDASNWNSIPRWDSTGQIDLILALEREFGVRFSDEQSSRLRSFSLVVEVVAEARARRLK